MPDHAQNLDDEWITSIKTRSDNALTLAEDEWLENIQVPPDEALLIPDDGMTNSIMADEGYKISKNK